jgi:FolB domain-containing protein
MTDRIVIRDIALSCIIGANPSERVTKQDVVINLSLGCDLSIAGATDRLEDTLNYRTLKAAIAALVEGSRFFLIERLADRIAALCLESERVRAVTVTVDKPGALTRARSVAVEIRRERAG